MTMTMTMTKNKIQNRSFSIFHRSIMEGNWPALAYNGARTVYGKPVLRKFLNGLCKFRKHFTPICVTLLCAPPKLGCIISNFNPVFHGLVVMTFRTNFWRVWRFDTYFEMIQSFYIWVGGNPFFKKYCLDLGCRRPWGCQGCHGTPRFWQIS